jgi:hypothetical protein
MGFITRYGSFWGQIPQTSGRVFWVAPGATYTVEGRSYSASDQNDGLSPERAFLTLAQAVGSTTANVGDIIVVLPGTHTMATTVTIATAGITITGIPQSNAMYTNRMPACGRRNRTIITAAASTNALTVTAVDVEIAFMHFLLVSAQVSIAAANTADRMFVHDCTFSSDGVAESTATVGIGLSFSGTGTTTTLDNAHIRNCYFYNVGAKGGAVEASNTCVDTIIENSTFHHGGDTAWANAIFMAVSPHLGTIVRDCDFLVRATGTTITDAIDVQTATVDGSNTVLRCYVAVGGGAFNVTATADGIVVDSYTAGSTGTGTVLATS